MRKKAEEEQPEDRLQMLGEKLRTLREQQAARSGRKVYQRDAARICGIKEDRYRSYEYGRAQLPEKCAKALAAEWGIHWQEFFHVARTKSESSTFLFQRSLAQRPETDDVGPPKYPAEVLDAPVAYIGYVAASQKVDWTDPFETEEMEYVPAEMSARGRFCCRIKGDSCYPELWPDDLVIFQATEAPKLGSVVIHRSPDNLMTIKQLKHSGEQYILHPLNPAYKDEPATGVVLGAMVGLLRDINGLKITIYKRGDPLTKADLHIFATPH